MNDAIAILGFLIVAACMLAGAVREILAPLAGAL